MRVSKQWSLFKPEIEENKVIEEFDAYYRRIKETGRFNHIPFEVFEQWIHPNYLSDITVKNYAWMDYEKIKFDLVDISLQNILSINIVDSLKDSIIDDWSITRVEEINCDDADMAYWKNKGTWRIPPIVIDIVSIKSVIPKQCELNKPYQLVEGYSRLRNLHAIFKLKNSGQINLAESHLVYLMCEL